MTTAGIPHLEPYCFPLVVAPASGDSAGGSQTVFAPGPGLVQVISSWEVVAKDATVADTLEVTATLGGAPMWWETAGYTATDKGTVVFWRGAIIMAGDGDFQLSFVTQAESVVAWGINVAGFFMPVASGFVP